MSLLFDTNILIDYLHGVPEAAELLDPIRDRRISVVTWMEVLVGAEDDAQDAVLRDFLGSFQIVALDAPVAAEAVAVRRRLRVKLPDAIVYASALITGSSLVTRNTKDFPIGTPSVQVPYHL